MKICAVKKCDKCGEVVAKKGFLLYHTVSDYVTIRGDERPTYVNMEDNTTRVRWHFCYPCWFGIIRAAREETTK